MKQIEYGLVLAGGGTKGAYQVGACKALKELNINITSVVGVSIGAINAALFVQDDIEALENLYKHIEMNDVIEIPESMNINEEKNLLSFTNALGIAHGTLHKEGVTNQPLRETMEKYVNEEKIRQSNIDFGLVAFDMEKNTGAEFFKKDMPEGQMIEYLLASSCFPIFPPQEIDGKKYMDGGLYDNTPVNTLAKRGYNHIILLDIAGLGMVRSTEGDALVKTISPDTSLGGTFNFDVKNISKNITYGYLDTYKAFRKLMGNYYYFEKEEFVKLLDKFTLEEIKGMEQAAQFYNIPRLQVWTCDEFIHKIMDAYLAEDRMYNTQNEKLTISEIRKDISKGTGMAVTVDLLRHYPVLYKETLVQRLVSDYVLAGKAILSCLQWY